MSNITQIPLQYQITDPSTGRMAQPWAFWFTQFVADLPPIGYSTVINGVKSSVGDIYLYLGLDSAKGAAKTGDIYFAYDTGIVYTCSGSSWIVMFPSITGDVSNIGVGGTVLSLRDVNSSIGTFGDATHYPVITVDAKGRITNVYNEAVTTPGGTGLPGAPVGSIQYNSGTGFAGASTLTYNAIGDRVNLTNLSVSGSIGFSNPTPTLNNLLPTQTGNAGQILTTNGTNVLWESVQPYEFIFHYGDATPKLLLTVPANKVILSVNIVITTAFNGTGAALTVGDASNYSSVVAATDNNPSVISNWTIEPGVFFGSNTPIYLSITAGSGATQGTGLLTIQIQE